MRPEGGRARTPSPPPARCCAPTIPRRASASWSTRRSRGPSDPKLDYGRDVEPWLGEKAALWLSEAQRGRGDARRRAAVRRGHRQGAGGARPRGQGRRRALHRSAATRASDYKVNTAGEALRDRRRLRRAGHGGGAQADDRRRGGRLAGRVRALPRRRSGDLPDERLAHAYLDAQGAGRRGPAQRPRGAPAVRAVPRLVLGLDELGPIDRRVHRRRRTPGGRHGHDRGGAAAAAAASACSAARRRRRCSASCPATRGARSGCRRWASRCGSSTAARRRDRRRGDRGPAARLARPRPRAGRLQLDRRHRRVRARDARSRRSTAGSSSRSTDEETADRGVRQARRPDAHARRASIRGPCGSTAPTRRSPISDAGQPKPIVVARGDDRVVATYGEPGRGERAQAGREADGRDASSTGPRSCWATTSSRRSCSPCPPSSMLAARSPRPSDPEFQQAKPYLEAFGVIAAGGARETATGCGRGSWPG